MRRAVERYLEDPLAEQIIKGSFHEEAPILVGLAEDKLVFRQKEASAGPVATSPTANSATANS
jgi:ATP-dependent Clp protease ATP-binding subunit ClpA